MGARELIDIGSWWITEDGRSISVWNDKWLPRPFSFRHLIPSGDINLVLKIFNLIDHDSYYWWKNTVRNIFRPCDVDVILNIILCPS